MKIFHRLLALIASVTDRQLARYVEFLKAENKILRSRIKGQMHTRPDDFSPHRPLSDKQRLRLGLSSQHRGAVLGK